VQEKTPAVLKYVSLINKLKHKIKKQTGKETKNCGGAIITAKSESNCIYCIMSSSEAPGQIPQKTRKPTQETHHKLNPMSNLVSCSTNNEIFYYG